RLLLRSQVDRAPLLWSPSDLGTARRPGTRDTSQMGARRLRGFTGDPIEFRGSVYRSPKSFNAGTHRTQAPAETFRTVKPFLEQAGVTRIADVTGLDNVGVPTTLAIRPNAL